MDKIWVISGLCITLLVSGTGNAQENRRTGGKCSLDISIEDPNSLEALAPWFIHEKHQSLEEYQQRIDELEAQTGAYGEQLAPALISQGLIHQEAGRHADANTSFERALQLIRINNGLYSPRQLPLMELLVATNTATENWKEVTDNLDTMYWLYKRNYQTNDPRFLNIIKRLRRWHIDSYNKKTGRSLSQHFKMAENLYTHAIDIIQACTGDRQQALCFWHKSCCADAQEGDTQCPAT